jgi:hypothetical protein
MQVGCLLTPSFKTCNTCFLFPLSAILAVTNHT